MGWINVFCIIIVICLLIPIIITNKKCKDIDKQSRKSSFIVEKIFKYSAMFLMIFHIDSFGFSSVSIWIIWTVANFCLIMLYWIFWISYSKNSEQNIRAIIIVIQGLIFILSGVVFEYFLLIICGSIFTIVSLYNIFKSSRL